ncbi:hypothetical protein PMZ80_002223 [Knufia obscura]|uniref:Uncharacterized protein n=2 Tax=Knufia TaxID=430999 RepID=A0AAN8EAZ7_9EURO|nr:hypothetical protein PMZ80_002223 [Knufia obscura]KAK5950583.1 hypothetical protein OHC33_008249 [Knufia fluminis]
MSGGEQRQSRYGAPYQSSGSGRPPPGQPMGPPSQEQYSQTAPSPSRSGMAAQSSARPYLSDYQYSYQQPQFQSQLQYPATYLQDPSRPQQLQPSSSQQQYAAYGHGSMLPPVGQQSMYENLPQYQQQRHSAAIEVMASQFGGGGIPPYMQQSETNTPVQSSSQYLSSQPEQQYGSMSYSRPQLQPPFTPASAEYSILEQPTSQRTQEETNARQATEEGRRQYEQQLRVIFDAITAGRVREASTKLLGVTEWLVGSVRALGLHHDDEESHEPRLLLWRELNHAWEALGQRQKSITENALRIRQQPLDFLSATNIQDLIEQLIRLCDQIEKYGLVDYEMGIWEEQIVDIFTQCLDLLPREQARARSGSVER